MTVDWLFLASVDVDAIAAYIAQDNPTAALRVGQRIVDLAEGLADFPRSGRPGRVDGTRELVVSGTPYIVAYRVRGNRVEILRVLHGARRWPTTF